MKHFIALLLNGLALLTTAYIVPGFKVESFLSALLAALVIGFINTILRPVLTFLTLPINLVTFGLFTFMINALVLYLASLFVPGFKIEGLAAALLGAVVLAIVSTILSHLVKNIRKTL